MVRKRGIKGGFHNPKIVEKEKYKGDIALKHHDKTIREIIEGALAGKPTYVKSQLTVNDIRRYDEYHQIHIMYDAINQDYIVSRKNKVELDHEDVMRRLEAGIVRQYHYAFDIPTVELCLAEVIKEKDRARQYIVGAVHFGQAFQEVSHLIEELQPEEEGEEEYEFFT